ncbi:MAG: DnaJ domain-containing protein [Taibaiella sp.]
MLQDFKDYYSRLDITFTATEAEIKAAYRKMARENHPDMHPEESAFYTEKFQEITEAYEVLSDPLKKGNYDFRYRQLVLHEGPQYEYFEDDTPENTNTYEHRYTTRNKRKTSYFSYGIMAVLALQLIRSVFGNSTNFPEPAAYRSDAPVSLHIQHLLDSMETSPDSNFFHPAKIPDFSNKDTTVIFSK